MANMRKQNLCSFWITVNSSQSICCYHWFMLLIGINHFTPKSAKSKSDKFTTEVQKTAPQ